MRMPMARMNIVSVLHVSTSTRVWIQFPATRMCGSSGGNVIFPSAKEMTWIRNIRLASLPPGATCRRLLTLPQCRFQQAMPQLRRPL